MMALSSDYTSYKFQNTLIIGSFQPLHNGHIHLIKTALTISNVVTIFVKNLETSNTTDNPWSFQERKELIEMIFKAEYNLSKLRIVKLTTTDHPIEHYKTVYQHLPDLLVTGESGFRKNTWYYSYDIAVLKIPHYDNISATHVRWAIVDKDVEYLVRALPKEILLHFDELYKRMKDIQNGVQNGVQNDTQDDIQKE